MSPLFPPFALSAFSKVPRTPVVSKAKFTSPQPSVQTGLIADHFQRGNAPVHFGSDGAPQSFNGGDEAPNTPSRWNSTSLPHTEEEVQPLLSHGYSDAEYAATQVIEPMELAGMDLSTPQISNSLYEVPSKRGRKRKPIEDLARRTLLERALEARNNGDHEEADKLYKLASEKKAPRNVGPRKKMGRLAPSEESKLSDSALRVRAMTAKSNGDLAEANRLYELARQNRPSRIVGPKKQKARHNAPESELAAYTIQEKALAAKRSGNLTEANRLYELAREKRQNNKHQTPEEPVQQSRTRSVFSPLPEVRSHLSAHFAKHSTN